MQPAGGNVQSQHPGGTIGEVLAVMERHDTPPYLQKLTINRYQGNNVSISTKAIDDKGLKEITFRIFDAAGTQVQDQTLSNLGKIWQGTSKTFQLSAGRYKAVGQAVDTAGNTSQEQSVTFEVTGSQVVPSAPATPSTTSVPQASTDSSESAASTSK
jgi:predicted phage tail protein